MRTEAELYLEGQLQNCDIKINCEGVNQIKILIESEDFPKTKITQYVEDFSPKPIKTMNACEDKEIVIIKKHYAFLIDDLIKHGILESIIYTLKNSGDVICTSSLEIDWRNKKVISLK